MVPPTSVARPVLTGLCATHSRPGAPPPPSRPEAEVFAQWRWDRDGGSTGDTGHSACLMENSKRMVIFYLIGYLTALLRSCVTCSSSTCWVVRWPGEQPPPRELLHPGSQYPSPMRSVFLATSLTILLSIISDCQHPGHLSSRPSHLQEQDQAN